VPALERDGVHRHAGLAQARDVVLELRVRIPLVARAAADERLLCAGERRGVDLRRHVTADRDDTVDAAGGRGRGTKTHRDSLRERGQHQPCRLASHFARRGVNHAFHVGEVVGDRQLAILTRHPAGNHLVGTPLIEAVETLNRHQRPTIRAWNRAQAFELRFGALGIAMETDEQTSRRGRRSREQQIPSVGGGRDVPFDHQMTFTTPEPRMSASRVMSGRSMVRAVAQMSASNGSRLNRSSSAR
jgi:hypothetical protein